MKHIDEYAVTASEFSSKGKTPSRGNLMGTDIYDDDLIGEKCGDYFIGLAVSIAFGAICFGVAVWLY